MSAPVDYERLVDPRTGLLTSVDRLPHDPVWPGSLVMTVGQVAHIGRQLPWPADRASTGTAFDDETAARRAAIGEAVERYCGNFIPAGLRRASYAELAAAGEPAVDPATLCLYSPRQYAHPGSPFVPFTADLPVLWARGYRLRDRAPVWVPASLVWVNYFVGPRAAEPRTNFVLYAGIAAGAGRADAERSALEEIIERDATEIWWRAGGPGIGLDPTASPRAAAAFGTARPSPLRYSCVLVPSVFGVPVVGVLAVDPDHDVVGLGLAARPDPVDALRKALAEAVSLRSYALGLADPEGTIWQAIAAGMVDGTPFKPWRADRAYLDSYRPDFRDVLDLGCQSQVYLDPRTRPWLTHLAAPPGTVSLGDVPAVAGDPRQAYLDRLAAEGIEAYGVDLTTPDVAAAGLSVVRVVAPGTYSNAPAGLGFLGGRRQYTEPARLGWTDRELTEDDLRVHPIPHT
ncbi:MAG TPA: YcaO-like family protein [Pilimelia sp.]|nr:YcaO-like family protein [Pilimelia sp.]